jgi:thiol-disulfide isomerase/thioredoxin
MFGFIEPKPTTTNIGHLCLELDGRFYEMLRSIMDDVKRRLPSQRQPKAGQEMGQEESWLHYMLKFLVVKHLIDNLKVPEEFVETEKDLGFTAPDVYVSKPREIAVEIETFYGSGEPYNVKLAPKLKKYEEAYFKGELWLVVPNIQALLYVDDLLKLRRDYRQKLNVEVYTLDLTGKGAELTYGERRQAGLMRLIDLLKLFKDRGLRRHQNFLKSKM